MKNNRSSRLASHSPSRDGAPTLAGAGELQ